MNFRSRLASAALAICAIFGLAPPRAQAQTTNLATTGSAARGERLFIGAVALRNGGPACVACHRIAGLPFPNGGTLGPDLTHAYSKLGPSGTQSALQTLYFKVMTPIYSVHPLFPDEQIDLIAFLQQAESRSQLQWITQILLLSAVILGGAFVLITGLIWRDRTRSVRRTLVERATGKGARL